MAEARANVGGGIAGSDKDFISKLHELMSFLMLQSRAYQQGSANRCAALRARPLETH